MFGASEGLVSVLTSRLNVCALQTSTRASANRIISVLSCLPLPVHSSS
jgi:hypothetical protein